MDGIVGLSCQPVEISGRNWIQRRAAAEAIRHDPDWNNGNYDKNPTHYIYSAAAGSFMPREAESNLGPSAQNNNRAGLSPFIATALFAAYNRPCDSPRLAPQ